jgi:hypothetical protein
MSFVTLGREDDHQETELSDDVGFSTMMPDVILIGLLVGGLWLLSSSSRPSKKTSGGIEVEPESGSGRFHRGLR